MWQVLAVIVQLADYELFMFYIHSTFFFTKFFLSIIFISCRTSLAIFISVGHSLIHMSNYTIFVSSLCVSPVSSPFQHSQLVAISSYIPEFFLHYYYPGSHLPGSILYVAVHCAVRSSHLHFHVHQFCFFNLLNKSL